jgi:hypothetical protein
MSNLLDYSERVVNHYATGQLRGKELGFKCLKELITFKPKYTTYLLGFPRAGKTEFHLEILFNMTEKHKWKHALMSPEIGGVEDVIGELVSKYLRSQFFKSSYGSPTEKQLHQAMNDLSQYFYVMDNDEKDYSIENFYEDCLKIETDNKIKLNTTSIDPWNDLDEDLTAHGGREDKYLAWSLRKVRATAKKYNWHNFIVTHAKEMPVFELKSTFGKKVICTAVPTLQAFAGGQVWSRRAFNVIGLWKPENGAINPVTSLPYAENEAMVKILKAKPKGVGKLGFAHLFFDWKTNRYYEMIDDKKYYAYEYESIPQKVEEEIIPTDQSLINTVATEIDLGF